MVLSKLATAIGSMPHKDVDYTISFIFENFKEDIPFWPQLVNLGFKENMYAQFCEGLPNIIIKENKIFFDIKDGINSDIFFENLDNLEYFKISPSFSLGFHKFIFYLKKEEKIVDYLKGQITGPITFGLKVTDQDFRCSIYNEELAEIIKIHLSKKALWQIDKLKDFCKKVIIFIDEPYLGSVGSAYVQLGKTWIIENLNYIIKEIKKAGAIAGIHCCADTDWSFLLNTEIDIISFDAYNYFDEFSLYTKELKRFLKRGGIIAFGIVPANNKIQTETEESLLKKLNDEFETLIENGLDKEKVLSQFILTPSCGVGSLNEDLAEKILKTTRDLTYLLKK
jgi:methionine synthase II (cobalamin-independent)